VLQDHLLLVTVQKAQDLKDLVLLKHQEVVLQTKDLAVHLEAKVVALVLLQKEEQLQVDLVEDKKI